MRFVIRNVSFDHPMADLKLLNWRKICHSRDDEQYLIPPELGNGYFRRIKVDTDIQFIIRSLESNTDLEFDIVPDDLGHQLSFKLAGPASRCLSNIDGSEIGIPLNCRSYAERIQIPHTLKIPANEKYLAFSVWLKPSFLKGYGIKICDNACRIKPTGVDGRYLRSPHRLGIITPEMLTVVYDILSTTMKSPIKKVFLIGKTLELLGLHIARSKSEAELESIPPQLNEADIDRIYLAEQILLKNLKNPPSLKKLAEEAGLNDYKLKIGFRYVFGNSVFRHLQFHRLETAKRLLNNGNMNVTEVMEYTGYSSLSFFASIFRDRFGINPGTLRSSPT